MFSVPVIDICAVYYLACMWQFIYCSPGFRPLNCVTSLLPGQLCCDCLSGCDIRRRAILCHYVLTQDVRSRDIFCHNVFGLDILGDYIVFVVSFAVVSLGIVSICSEVFGRHILSHIFVRAFVCCHAGLSHNVLSHCITQK